MKRPRPAAAVDASAPLALDALLESSVPLVLEGRARGSCWVRLWPALEARGQRLRTAFRTHRADGGAPRSVREAECAVVSATLGEFSAWARGEKGCAAFEGLGSAGWAYADYKRWHELFGDDDDSKVIIWPDGSTEIPADREERHTSTAALYLFLFMTFIVLSICVGNFLHSHHFYYLPESGAVVILGLRLR